MSKRFDSDDLAPAALGTLALALAAGSALGIVQPDEAGMANNVPGLGVAALVAGVIGLFIGKTRGPGRQVAIIGSAAAILVLIVYGGLVAFESLA